MMDVKADGRMFITPIEIGEQLVSAAEKLARLAEPAVSNFKVGAVALGASGKTYGGFNIELPQQPLQQTVHAEHFCISAAIGSGREDAFVAIGVTAAPCGHCRQMLAELPGSKNMQIFLRDARGIVHSYWLLDDLLPLAITSDLLGVKPKSQAEDIEAACEKLTFSNPTTENELGGASPKTVMRSYARSESPYSFSKSGCVIVTKDGASYSGSAYESVAFNPGVPPFQAAMIEMCFSRLGLEQETLKKMDEHLDASTELKPDLFPHLAEQAKSVVIAQSQNARINHEGTVKTICDTLAPNVNFISCRIKPNE